MRDKAEHGAVKDQLGLGTSCDGGGLTKSVALAGAGVGIKTVTKAHAYFNSNMNDRMRWS